jgi:hypothetical protein
LLVTREIHTTEKVETEVDESAGAVHHTCCNVQVEEESAWTGTDRLEEAAPEFNAAANLAGTFGSEEAPDVEGVPLVWFHPDDGVVRLVSTLEMVRKSG